MQPIAYYRADPTRDGLRLRAFNLQNANNCNCFLRSKDSECCFRCRKSFHLRLANAKALAIAIAILHSAPPNVPKVRDEARKVSQTGPFLARFSSRRFGPLGLEGSVFKISGPKGPAGGGASQLWKMNVNLGPGILPRQLSGARPKRLKSHSKVTQKWRKRSIKSL